MVLSLLPRPLWARMQNTTCPRLEETAPFGGLDPLNLGEMARTCSHTRRLEGSTSSASVAAASAHGAGTKNIHRLRESDGKALANGLRRESGRF